MPVIETVTDFISRLAATLARQAVEAAAGGEAVDATLERWRGELGELFDGLPDQPDLSDALYGAPARTST